MLEDKWEAYSQDVQSSILLSAENLRTRTETSFNDALSMLREDTDANLKSALFQGFAVIGDSFDYSLDEAVELFGQEMINLISAFSDQMSTHAQGLDYTSPSAKTQMDLLNKKGAQFAEKVKGLKLEFDDSIAEIEEDFDEADGKSRVNYDVIVNQFFATADKESEKILAMVFKKIDNFENSFQNRFAQCETYLDEKFQEQRELFDADVAGVLEAIEAPAPAPQPAAPAKPTKVVEVYDEKHQPHVVREDNGAVVEPTVVQPVEQPVEDVYVPDYDGKLQIATWNVALARGFDPTVDLRLKSVSEAAAQMPADVVCLQEVWTQQDLDEVKSMLWSTWHDVHFSFEQDEPYEIPCDAGADETLDLLDCVAEECADADSLGDCIFMSCLEELNDLDGQCKNCLIANSASDGDLFETCTTTPASSFIYGGHNGLILAAKFPINNIMFMEFDSHLQKTGVLYGEVLEAQIACTHLNSDYPGIEYAGNFGSWDG